MKCTRCNKNEATMYFKQNINGEIREYALCPECVKAEGLDMGLPIAHLNLFTPVTRARAEKKRCQLCGSSFEDIRAGGKVGCGKCYETFEEELRPTVNSLHGWATHIPRQTNEKPDDKVDEIDKLKAEQKKAVEAEDYERAAELRDRIRELEGK